MDLKSGSLDAIVRNTASTVDDAPYIFEITNMDDGELRSFMNRLMNIQEEQVEASEEDENANKKNTKKAKKKEDNIVAKNEGPALSEQAMVNNED